MLSTALGGIAAAVGASASTVANVFWLNSPLSLWSQFTFMLVFLGVVNLSVLVLLATYYGDARIVLIHHDAAQRRLWCWGARRETAAEREAAASEDAAARAAGASAFSVWLSRLSQAETLVLLGINNGVAGLLQWYSTPPDRTPPLLQGVLPAATLVFAIPLSKVVLGDRKVYLAPEPLIAVGLVLTATIISLEPTLAASAGGTGLGGAESPSDVLAWAAIYLASQLPGALAFLGQQVYLLRSGVHRPGATWRDNQTSLFRMMFYNQIVLSIFAFALWWIDILPWFGSTPDAAAFWTGVRFSFACSLGATSGGDCDPSTPTWGAIFLCTYVLYLTGTAVVSQDSGVFSTLIQLAQATVVSTIFLVPGVNPDPSGTPVWSVVVSLLLSIAGVVVFKRWEARQGTIAEQFVAPCLVPVPDSSHSVGGPSKDAAGAAPLLGGSVNDGGNEDGKGYAGA